jgi:glutamate-5-semialdehyde dehydrogenase
MTVADQARSAKNAGFRLLALSREVKDKALREIASRLAARKEEILEANREDLALAKKRQIAMPLQKRLELSEAKIAQMIAGIEDLIALEDPVGRTVGVKELDEGLVLHRETAPIGLIGVIFESRPDALVQIGCLCLKSGNAVILKGGSEAAKSNRVLHRLMSEAMSATDDAFRDALQLVETREEIGELLKLDSLVDLMIPRGSNSLVRHIQDNTKIPVLGHAEGICHMYVDSEAERGMALELVWDAKCQYVAVCNALETLLVHERIANDLLPRLKAVLRDVELRGDEKARAVTSMNPAVEEDWSTEYNDLILSIKVVESLDEAVRHINRYGSHHTDSIVTRNEETAKRFMDEVDSASVMWNCSTRFADGYRYGLGAEVGISTGKIHARGPVGLEGLTIYKYKLVGKGHTVAPYAEGKRRFTHRDLEVEGGIQ